VRLDKLLYCLRFARSRSLAQRWIAEGHIRRNGARVVRQDQPVGVGDILTLPLRSRVLPIEIVALPARRGPAAEARECYRELDGVGARAIAGEEDAQEEGPALP
jgi:ribosome-associated heat shock protein Hsp15